MVKMESLKICYLLLVIFLSAALHGSNANRTLPFDVSVILDMETLVGKMGMTSLLMAIDDFYSLNSNYKTRVVLHTRDSREDVVQAAGSGIDLLQNKQVQAIIGPQKSSQAIFLSELANKLHVPFLSFSATSPSLSSTRTPYFIRTSVNDSFQVNGPLTSLINAHGWKEVILVYEDTEYGRGIIPYLVDAFQSISTHIVYRSVILLSSSDDQIMEELYKLMTMEAKVFVVHMTAPIGVRLFLKAKEVGMMSEGYVWIMTGGLSNIVDSLDSSVVKAMVGCIGIKLYVPSGKELDNFSTRWKKRFQKENPNDLPAEPNIVELWAYDTAWALGIAAESVGVTYHNISNMVKDSIKMSTESVKLSENGPKLLENIISGKFRGLSGQFHLVDGELHYSTFEIINILGRGSRHIGFWTPEHGISRKLPMKSMESYSTSVTNLNSIVWPGETTVVPKGWQKPINGKKLRIGVPLKTDFQQFVKVENNPITNVTIVSGYSIEVFEAVVQNLPYSIPYEYIPFEDALGHCAGTYDDLVYQVYLQKFDAVVGDISILANRSNYVDFTLPYTETGVAMIVPVKECVEKNIWIFLKPLTTDLWLASFAFFFFTGFVVWVMEHRINDEFRGPCSQQLGTIFYFVFSTLVFAHREKLENLLSKLVLIVWVFTVLILTSSYTASLSSMLTVCQLQPTVTDVYQLQKNGDYVGYPKGGFQLELLKQHRFDESKILAYDTGDQYVEALSKGSQKGGVAAIFDSIPYIKLFLAKHCTGFTMVGPVYKSGGMGFVFPKGSPLVPDISRGILNVTEGDVMFEIEKKWFADPRTCEIEESPISTGSLKFRSFWGLFIITGVISTCALLLFFANFLYRNWHELRHACLNKSIGNKLSACFKYFDSKDTKFHTFRRGKTDYTDSRDDVSMLPT